jgi:hypothetical protein
LALLGWALWPIPVHEETIALGPLTGLLPSGAPADSALGPEFSLHVGFQRIVRLGGRSAVTARLEPDGPYAEDILPPDTNLVAVAHIQTSDVMLDPNGEIFDPLPSGGRASYSWRASPLHAGVLEATLFLRLELVSNAGAQVTTKTVLARPLPMRALSPLGLTQTADTALGMAAVLTGGVLLLGALLGRLPRREEAR